MTPKIKEFAEKMYPHDSNVPPRPVFIEGILIGAEFAEWTDLKYTQVGNGVWRAYHLYEEKSKYTTTELLDIFITEKMKELEKGRQEIGI